MAQPSKGRFVINGTAGFTNSIQNYSGYTVYISPGLDYFFSNKFSVGVKLGYQYYDLIYNDYGYQSFGFTINTFSARASLKSHIHITESLYFGIRFELGGIFGDIKGFLVNITPSLDYFLSRRWILNLSMGGLQYTHQNGDSSDDDIFGFGWTTPELGISLMF